MTSNDATTSRNPRLVDRRTTLRGVFLAGTAVATSSILAACGPDSAQPVPNLSKQKPRRGGHLTVGLTGGSSSDTLNPFFGGVSAIGTARAQQLYQPLVQLGPDAQLQYILADEIVAKDPRTWIIRLKRGVTFHDGKSFGADDVIYTLRTILNPKDPLGGATVLSPIDISRLRKVDDHTVEVPMKTPFGSFPEQLAAFWYFLYIAPNGWTDKDKPNGTGPFTFGSFKPGEYSVFTRNANYWRSSHPYLDAVTIRDFQDGNAVQNALISGSIDCTGQLTGTQMKILQRTKGIVALPSHTGAIEPFTMRTDKGPFADVRVRQAMRYLVDREKFITATLDGFGTTASDVTSPYDPDFDPFLKREHDVSRAKSLLRQAGYDGDLTVTLDTSLAVNSSAINMSTVLKEQAKAAGVTINLNQVSPGQYFNPNYYTNSEFAQIYYNYSPYLSQVSQTFLRDSPFPEVHFSNSRYEFLYAEANKTTDPVLRKSILHDMQRIDFDEGGYIIPCFVDSLDAYSTRIAGYQTGKVGEPLGNFNFEDYYFLD